MLWHNTFIRLRNAVIHWHIATQDLTAFGDAYQRLWLQKLPML